VISIESFRKKINKYIKNNNKKSGLKEIKIIKKFIGENYIPHDHIIGYLGTMKVFYNAFDLYEDEIDTLINLADIYSTYKAYQSAYRTLSEAEDIAREKKDLLALASINFISAGIYSLEGDIEFSLKMAEQSKAIYNHLQIKAPDALISNIATIYMNTNKVEDAIDLYKSLLETKNIELLFALYMNLSICYRKNDNINEAIKYIDKSRELFIKVSYNPEQFTEFELVATKIYLKNKQFDKALNCLEKAVIYLNQILEQTNKLHYRRGIREQYINRIEGLLLEIPCGEVNDKVLKILSFIRSTLTSDWLYILEWSDEIYANNDILNKEKDELKDIINKLTNFGAPFLFGYREKYDDHYDAMFPGKSSWELLNEFIFKITEKYNISSPYKKTSIKEISNLFKLRLNEQNCIIISFLSKYNKLLILNNNNYEIVSVEEKKILDFYISITKYRNMEFNTKEFAFEVTKIEELLYDTLSRTLDKVDKLNIKSIMYIPDKFDFVPLTTIVLKNKNLKEKILDENFFIKTTPILFPQKKVTIKRDKILGVIDNTDDLYLSKMEVDNFSKLLKIENISFLSSNEREKCSLEMKNTNILHVTTHGFPITNLSDPYYADLSGNIKDPHCINTNHIQENFYKYNYNLVILNSCHSSSSILRSQQSTQKAPNELKTNDIFNFPIILLMNRKSAVISSVWRTFDKFALIFSYNLGKNIEQSNDIEKSFSKSLATIYDIELSSINENLNNLNQEAKEFIESNTNTILNMVKHPYCYGTYQLYTLF
jgi:tetratricopeptide (TPR) repeat protein